MNGIFNHLHLRDWPFTVVPIPERCTYIAGRPQLDSDIDELLNSLSRRETSSMHVFWSWFGAGKTHSLYYLANRVNQMNNETQAVYCFPVYTEFPRSVRSFVDLYKALTVKIDMSVIGDAFLELETSPTPQQYYAELIGSHPDLASALRIFSTGTEHDKLLASRWFRGDKVPISDFRRIGISQRIDSSDLAVRTMASIIRLLGMSQRAKGKYGHRLIWAIDELQRVESIGRRAVLDVNAGLHSLFNECPTGLTFILSFTGQPNSHSLPSWFSSELKDRLGVTKVMIMPPLSRDDGLKFVVDVLAHFRTSDSHPPSPFFPFTRDACGSILKFVEDRDELRPRYIMDAFNAVLEKADTELLKGNISEVDSSFADDVLSQHAIVSSPPDDE